MTRNWTPWLLKLQLFWLVLVLAAGLCIRTAFLPWRPALMAIGVAVSGLMLTGFFSLVVLYVLLRTNRQGNGKYCLWAVALSLPALAFALLLGMRGAKAPPIHDITTDTDTPPPFLVTGSFRHPGDNSVRYPGQTVADQQRRAYPDIGPLEVPIPSADAFARSLAVAAKLRWRIVGQNRGEGVIEALDRTPVLGFTDDIVIRVTATGKGSRIDLRSASRVGVSDLGTNATRIRNFVQTFKEIQPN